MNLFDVAKVLAKRLRDLARQQSDAILSSFTVANHDVARGKFDVLHSQLCAFEKPESGAVEQARHELRRAGEMTEDSTDLFTREDDR